MSAGLHQEEVFTTRSLRRRVNGFARDSPVIVVSTGDIERSKLVSVKVLVTPSKLTVIFSYLVSPASDSVITWVDPGCVSVIYCVDGTAVSVMICVLPCNV